MGTIEIIKKREPEYEGVWDYVVQIGPEADQIGFLVHLEPGYYEKLTGGKRPPESLLKRTFEFLLAKTVLQDIPREFNCKELALQYSDYEDVMRKKMRRLGLF